MLFQHLVSVTNPYSYESGLQEACKHTLHMTVRHKLCMQDLRHFLLMSFVLNLAIFFVQVPWMVRYQLSGKPLLIQFVFLFLNIMVPFLPAALVVLKSVTLLRMRYQGLQVSRSESLYTAAQLDLVVFDKTGTLTAEQVPINPSKTHC